VILTGVSMLVVALDQLSKFYVLQSLPLNQSIAILPNYCYLTLIQNPGTAFGLMSNMDDMVRIPFFVIIIVAAACIVYSYQRVIPEENFLSRVALGLVWGGALGNFIDRILYGKVIDFIDVCYADYHWYIFNVADAFITVGLIYLLYGFLTKMHPRRVL